MRKLPLLFIFLFQLSFGQQSKIDSLSTKLNKNITDSEKINLLEKLQNLTLKIDFNKSLEYNNALIILAKKEKKNNSLARAYEHKSKLETQQGDYNEAEKFNLLALEIYKKLDSTNNIRDIYSNTARIAYMMGNRNKAITYYKKAIYIDSINNNEKKLLKTYLGIGVIYLSQNDLDVAINYFISSLKLSEKNNDNIYIAHNNKKIADAYILQNNTQKAQKYLIEAEKNFTKLESYGGLASTLNSRAIIYEKNNNIESALNYYRKSLKNYQKINNNNDAILTVLQNIGLQHDKLKNTDEALKTYKNALSLAKRINSKKHIAKIYLSLAKLEIDRSNYKLSENYLKEAESFKNINEEFNKIDNYDFIAKAYANKGKYNLAYKYLSKYHSLTKKSFEKLKSNQFSILETKYQTEKKEKENLQLKAKNTEQALLTQKANTRNWLLLFGLLAVGISAFFIFRRYKSEAKARKIISQQKDEIEQQKNLVETLQKELHHRMKNNLSFIDLFISLAKGKFQDPAYQTKLNELQNRMHSMFEVHKQLFKKDDVTTVKAKNYINTLVENVQKSYAEENITFSNTTHISETILADTSFPVGLIVNEFVTNSYKYAFDDATQGRIDINLASNPKEYILQLKDNGKGLPEDFNINNLDSFGLETIQLLTQEYGGTFTLNGTNGVTMNITLPKTAA